MHNGQRATDRPASPPSARDGRLATFVILFAMNLLDYLDRNVLMVDAAAGQGRVPHHQRAVGPADEHLPGQLLGVQPVMGWLGDRYRRTWLLGLGVGVWSLATVGSGLASSYGHLALARSFLGIGEATYGVIAPTILLDLFPREQRSRLLSAFYLAMPLAARWGWCSGRTSPTHYGLAPGLLRRRRARAWPRRCWPCSCPSRSAGRARGSTSTGSRRTSRPGHDARTTST